MITWSSDGGRIKKSFVSCLFQYDKVDLCVYYYDGEKYTQFKEMK